MKFTCVDVREFTLGINPAELTTAQEKGVRLIRSKSGKMIPMFYKKARSVQNEKLIDFALKPYAGLGVKNDGDTAIDLEITYFFPHTSGTPKWKLDQLTFMTQRPDADNISKALVDRMTANRFWDDDSMVNFRFRKYRWKKPHIKVKIEVWRQEKETV